MGKEVSTLTGYVKHKNWPNGANFALIYGLYLKGDCNVKMEALFLSKDMVVFLWKYEPN